MPVALNHPAAVAYRGMLYVSGGYTDESALSEPSGALLRYNPQHGAGGGFRLPPHRAPHTPPR